jgi:hypothetical protein
VNLPEYCSICGTRVEWRQDLSRWLHTTGYRGAPGTLPHQPEVREKPWLRGMDS